MSLCVIASLLLCGTSCLCLLFLTSHSHLAGGLGDAAATAIAGHGQLREDGSLSGDYVRDSLLPDRRHILVVPSLIFSRRSQKSVTTTMIQAVPPAVMQWGLAGGIPYGGMALGTAYYAREAVNLAAAGENATQALEMLHTVQSFQITYGAVMLSFLGAIHWGMEFAKFGGRQGHKRCVARLSLLSSGAPADTRRCSAASVSRSVSSRSPTHGRRSTSLAQGRRSSPNGVVSSSRGRSTAGPARRAGVRPACPAGPVRAATDLPTVPGQPPSGTRPTAST